MKVKLGELKTVVNTKRKFGSKSIYYASFLKFDGVNNSVLFTLEDIEVAIARAKVNPEDMPQLKTSLFQKLFGWMK